MIDDNTFCFKVFVSLHWEYLLITVKKHYLLPIVQEESILIMFKQLNES